MARKPAVLELVGGKGPRQRIWDAIRRWKKGAFAVVDVCPGDVPTDTARTYVRSLAAGGYITPAKTRAGTTERHQIKQWTLTRDVGVEAPRLRRDGAEVTTGLAQEQMWRTIRTLKTDVSPRELAAHASTASASVAEAAAKDYLRHLALAGYMTVPKRGHGVGAGGVQSRYRLVKDTGPRPPMICRTKSIYDPNLGKIVWQADVTEEDAIYG